MIVLSDEGESAAFGAASQAPYLSKTLRDQGELLQSYYAVASGELANSIALISGQGPTPQTTEDCPLYTSVTPGTAAKAGQVVGSGCVYPASTLTLADQLANDGKTWRAYVEGIERSGAQLQACPHPAVGATDSTHVPVPGDGYVGWRNPFVYFQSLLSSNSACPSNDVGLGKLTTDLKAPNKTPSLAYIVPDRCHDGSPQPCAPGQPAGLEPADSFLRQVVPRIEASPAYKQGGLIAITFDQAPQSGPEADSSGCCLTVAYPNMPASASGSAGSGTSAAPATPSTGNAASGSAGSGVSSPTGLTPSGAPTASSGTPTGGGKVGLLLISKYVKPGSLDATGEYDHFSLLRTIEHLFGLQPVGYAAEPSLLAFDRSVFNASKKA